MFMDHRTQTWLLCALLAIAAGGASAASYNDALDGLWSNFATWGGGGKPGSGDGATVDSNVVTVDSTETVNTVYMVNSAARVNINSGGSLSLRSTWNCWKAGGTDINSGGELKLVQDGAHIYGSNNPDTPLNLNAGGKITVDLPSSSDSCEIGGQNGKLIFHLYGGTIDIQKGKLVLSANAGGSEAQSGSVTVASNGIFRLATGAKFGTVSEVAVSGDGVMEITAWQVGTGGLTIDTAGYNKWTAGSPRLDGPLTLAAGRTLEFSGPYRHRWQGDADTRGQWRSTHLCRVEPVRDQRRIGSDQ